MATPSRKRWVRKPVKYDWPTFTHRLLAAKIGDVIDLEHIHFPDFTPGQHSHVEFTITSISERSVECTIFVQHADDCGGWYQKGAMYSKQIDSFDEIDELTPRYICALFDYDEKEPSLSDLFHIVFVAPRVMKKGPVITKSATKLTRPQLVIT